jgi:hypothetical protein
MVYKCEDWQHNVENVWRVLPIPLQVKTFLEIIQFWKIKYWSFFLWLSRWIDIICTVCIWQIVLIRNIVATWQGLCYDWKNAIFKRINRREIEQKAEGAPPDILPCCFKRLPYNLVHLLVKIKTYTILVDKLADFFMNLTLVMLREIHKRFPIGAEAVMSESTLHLF